MRGRLCARSYTFQVVQGNADMFWKFQRYNLIVEYHGRPALAPPFILLSHLSLALQRLLGKRAGHTRERLGEPGARGGGPGPTGASPGPEPPSARWPHVQACLAHLARAQHPGAAVAPAELALPPERDLPEPLDQKILTWETVQKENFLGREEQRRRDSEGEVLRKTAHRCDSAGWGWGAAGPAAELGGPGRPGHQGRGRPAASSPGARAGATRRAPGPTGCPPPTEWSSWPSPWGR